MSDTLTLQEARAREAAGDLPGADAIYRAMHNPAAPNANVLQAWSRLRRRLGDHANATAMLQDATRAGAGPGVLVDIAGLLLDQGRVQEATQALQEASRAGRGPALDFEMARWESANGRHDKAAALYRALIKQEPRLAAPRLGYARTMAAMNKFSDAEGAYTALLNREPNMLPAMAELANLHAMQNRFGQAVALFDKMEALGADVVAERATALLAMQLNCDWSHRDAILAQLEARVRQPQPCMMQAFPLLSGRDDPALHRLMGERFAGAITALTSGREPMKPRAVSPEGWRLRIGYISGDLAGPVISTLLAGLFEAHDRSKFEVTCYDYSTEDGTPLRERMKASFEHWVDLTTIGPVNAAQRIAADGIDILVDLKGYTERTRSEIMALRPAPIQANFFGYPATTGAPWIDYIIADSTVLPPEEYHNWSEQPVLLPHSCVPNDRLRPRAETTPTRAECGLPEDALVFACFTSPFKITPETFTAWMQILSAVPNSVLWLFKANDLMAANLRTIAQQSGIDSTRLVFADPAALPEHMARHDCADLFLDPHLFSAHTAASDALWAGLPVITCTCRSMVSRATASALRAANLPDLITNNLTDYKTLAISLASDRTLRQALRARLLATRDTMPLYDATQFAQALESAYTTMADRHRTRDMVGPLVVA